MTAPREAREGWYLVQVAAWVVGESTALKEATGVELLKGVGNTKHFVRVCSALDSRLKVCRDWLKVKEPPVGDSLLDGAIRAMLCNDVEPGVPFVAKHAHNGEHLAAQIIRLPSSNEGNMLPSPEVVAVHRANLHDAVRQANAQALVNMHDFQRKTTERIQRTLALQANLMPLQPELL